MAICFWKLCHCPDATPCSEHSGQACSLLGGVNITKESDISDALTGQITTAIATLEGEKAAAERARQTMEDRRKQIEKDRDDLQRLIDNAMDRNDRSAVRDKYEELEQKHSKTISDLNDALGRYDLIVAYPIGQIARTQPLLIIPFTDPAGYCACYLQKQKRLAALAGALVAEQANCAALWAQLLTIRQNAKKYARFAMTLIVTGAGVTAWFLYVYLAINFFSGTTLLIVLAVALMLAAIVGYMTYLESAVASSQIRILQLMLEYYQLQSIPTCQKAGSTIHTDESWWRSLLKYWTGKELGPAPDPH